MRLTGLGVSPGLGLGKAVVVARGAGEPGFRIPEALVEREQERLDDARARSRTQIEQIRDRINRTAGSEHAYLFDAQLLMLDDPMLIDRAREIIRTQRLNASAALRAAFTELTSLFDGAQDGYLRERKGDIADVVGRIGANLRQAQDPSVAFRDVEGPFVLIAPEISPSLIAQLDWSQLAGIVTEGGSWTSHTAILARSVHVPAVAGVHLASVWIPPGRLVAVDGTTGEIVIDPEPEQIRSIRTDQERRRADEAALARFRTLPAVTADGVDIRLDANVEHPGETARAIEEGAAGIGLFRSEFLLSHAIDRWPSEEAQYAAYREIVERAEGRRVTIRTFDVSESQLLAETHGPSSRSPLGRRGIRLGLAVEPFFQTQLRALLRAAAHGPLRVMFPFVSGVEELRAARAAMSKAAAALRDAGTAAGHPALGIMIELPSAALTADLLAREADFFSIGTNDLIQYTLAVDRTDDGVSGLYEPLHPAILRALRLVARAGRHRHVPVSVCGEMAADPLVLAVLVGLGLREFSMAPSALPVAKQLLRHLDAAAARRVANRALRVATAEEVRHLTAELVDRREPAAGVTAGAPGARP